jgi:hypothetical protein
MEGLGRLFDISLGWAPVDTQTAAITGKRVSLKHASGITFLVIKAAGTANDDPVLDVQQYTAASGGTTADLDVVTKYYIKQETTLDGDETWTEVTQTAASEITLNSTSAETEMLVAIHVHASQLSDGYDYVGLNCADTGSAGAQLAACVYILHDLEVQRTPQNLVAPLS